MLHKKMMTPAARRNAVSAARAEHDISERRACKILGSGRAKVLVDQSGKLSLVTHANQDSPLMDGKHVLFGNDMWEHAYYLKYQNRRPAYLAAWWNVVSWHAVAARYQAATAGTLAL